MAVTLPDAEYPAYFLFLSFIRSYVSRHPLLIASDYLPTQLVSLSVRIASKKRDNAYNSTKVRDSHEQELRETFVDYEVTF